MVIREWLLVVTCSADVKSADSIRVKSEKGRGGRGREDGKEKGEEDGDMLSFLIHSFESFSTAFALRT